MSKVIPTAKTIIKNKEQDSLIIHDIHYLSEDLVIKLMQDFARLHTEAALKAASKVKVYEQVSYRSLSTSERESIYTAYPLTNIK